MSEAARISLLMSCLGIASVFRGKIKWRTDVYGIANQYSRLVKKTDFDLIKNKTFEEVLLITKDKVTIDYIIGDNDFETIKGKTVDELMTELKSGKI